MSVLSFDPTFIAYLKSETLYSDAFIAGMRAVGVVTGLIGTFLMPVMEKRIGLVRTGSYSLFAEVIPSSLPSYHYGSQALHTIASDYRTNVVQAGTRAYSSQASPYLESGSGPST